VDKATRAAATVCKTSRIVGRLRSGGANVNDFCPEAILASHSHQISDGRRVIAAPILGGLHHEYRLEPLAA
jgi:hypothetical protein